MNITGKLIDNPDYTIVLIVASDESGIHPSFIGTVERLYAATFDLKSLSGKQCIVNHRDVYQIKEYPLERMILVFTNDYKEK